MAVYEETNRQHGLSAYPYASASEQLHEAENEMLCYLRQDFFRHPDAFCAVWLYEGTYVSALRMERYRDGYLLTSLETAPMARRRGYGCALVQESLQYLRTMGCTAVYSHISKRNIPSLQLHTKCGFTIISESARFLDGTVTQESCTVCCVL